MLTLENIGIEFGGNWLFKGISYQFLPGERLALIGRNGAGKSTLLKIITEQLNPTEGLVSKSSNMKVAYFNQDLLSYQTERPISEVVRDAFAPLLELKAEINTLLKRMEDGEGDTKLWEELATKQDLFEARGGSTIDARVHSTLNGLGFSLAEHEQAYHTFSGGWRMRVLLAQMLLMEPELLLLDEPTNHLDLPSIQWLENYLKSFAGTTLVVTHDRFFVDRIAEKILEINFKRLHIYAGNYSFYVKEKALRNEQQLKAYENQQKYIAEQEKFISRFRAKATKAKQVQSKIKQLEKLDKIEAPESAQAVMNMRFELAQASGKEVLTLEHVDKAYGPKEILDKCDASVWRGDKIALIGANGVGKSTVLRVLADTETYLGERKEGHNVFMSFFAQHQLEALNLDNTVFEELYHSSGGKTETYIRNILGCFMFSGEDAEKPIRVLSGGERSRVALAKTLVSKANFLLLDEPTNHLDIQSIEVLIEALDAYEGSYVLVSHDRHFLSHIANKIWYIEGKQIKEYPGTYQEFVEWKTRQELENEEVSTTKSQKPEQAETQEKPQLSFQQQKQIKNRLKKLSRSIETLEEDIMEWEEKKSAQELHMAKPEVAADYKQLQEAQTELQKIDEKIARLSDEWESAIEELETLQSQSS